MLKEATPGNVLESAQSRMCAVSSANPRALTGFSYKFPQDSAWSHGMTQGLLVSFCFPEECSDVPESQPAVGNTPSAPLYPHTAADRKPAPGKERNWPKGK